MLRWSGEKVAPEEAGAGRCVGGESKRREWVKRVIKDPLTVYALDLHLMSAAAPSRCHMLHPSIRMIARDRT